jgi:hypothetical protein
MKRQTTVDTILDFVSKPEGVVTVSKYGLRTQATISWLGSLGRLTMSRHVSVKLVRILVRRAFLRSRYVKVREDGNVDYETFVLAPNVHRTQYGWAIVRPNEIETSYGKKIPRTLEAAYDNRILTWETAMGMRGYAGSPAQREAKICK